MNAVRLLVVILEMVRDVHLAAGACVIGEDLHILAEAPPVVHDVHEVAQPDRLLPCP